MLQPLRAEEIRLAVLLGEWFATNLQRVPTRAEIDIALDEIRELMKASPDGINTAMLDFTMRKVRARIGVP